MASLTSTHRGFDSASLTVAPTQNTAPVHEFRCLYTRDLHKKAKKWHDGSLRFHTFNRRVMVYDDAKNYIGDLHYRQEGEFAEGVEIQLDRGVMVEVGERLGETQTDLAPILERSRPEKPALPPRQAAALANRPLSTGPSQRPKSLLEVLGPSQGRLGRARLPVHSPYEQRWSSSRVDPVESPRKRLRLDRDKENHFDHVHHPDRSARPRLPQPMQPSKTVPQTARCCGAPTECEDLIELSSDEEPPSKRQPTKPARLGTVPSEYQRGSPDKQWFRPELLCPSPTALPQVDYNKAKPSKERLKRSSPPGNPKKSTNGESLDAFPPPVAHRSRLLIGQPKPRPRLTCLLPFCKGTSRPQTLEGCCQLSPRKSISTSSPREEEASLSKRAARAHLDDGRQPIQIPYSGQSSARELVQDDNINSSPLFIPEQKSARNSPSPRPLPTQEEFPFPGSDDSEPCQSLPKSNVPSSATAHPVTVPAQQLQVDVQAAVNAQCLRPKPPLELDPQSPNQPLLLPERPDGFDTRPFRRVMSENDALGNGTLTLIPDHAVPQPRNPSPVLSNLAARSPAKSESPSKLQRCASETNAVDRDNQQMGGLTEEGSNGPTGPWTADEAFLLFDWWPAAMEKPVYWKDEMEPVLPRGMPAAVPDVRAGITTARRFLFLRNDINVL
ncbi:uncharacterized protein Z519_02347 [Cladophialophora bantiana CBS 173.52]|uniref:5'-3' DNA helicase ZGRF1-like N-terminal domain-containing protein n=1 Tax=Cladophialophora bantiana (strain ATCC 10958 / CBS 173.52 / CDC B-1940 / NIH 8579) TaxID=1442370 RepID=A0A0D2F425_CLAB1|nr:uncharacterized protein Z519_02347 [Cladophialophora bantiana CBS 173.52]KIW96956.1 hypothetical protein Z519_02347 [Cladophialophora bantiana CBS 173.52]